MPTAIMPPATGSFSKTVTRYPCCANRRATVKPAGAGVLRKVGAILNRAGDRRVIVQGHTDNVPIVGRLGQLYPTNWELSAARAVNVVRFLHEEVGLEPSRLSASALSEYQPKTDNSTEEGRRQNRRIEIVLAPGIGREQAGETAGAKPRQVHDRPGSSD